MISPLHILRESLVRAMLHQEKRYRSSSKRKQRCGNNENLISSYTKSVLTELDILENLGIATQNSDISITLKLQEIEEEDEDKFYKNEAKTFI